MQTLTPRVTKGAAKKHFKHWTPRRVEVLHQLYRFHLLRTDQMVAYGTAKFGDLAYSNFKTGVINPLRDNGYIRPHEATREYVEGGGRLSTIWEITREGWDELVKQYKAHYDYEIPPETFKWFLRRSQAKGKGEHHVEHTLMTADAVLAIEIACLQSGIEFVDKFEMLRESSQLQAEKTPFKWSLQVPGYERRQTSKPDYIFAIVHPTKKQRYLYMVEADRNMEINRKDQYASSVGRHMDKYYAWHKQTKESREPNQFGTNTFRALFVEQDVNNMKSRMEQLVTRARKAMGSNRRDLFMFMPLSSLVLHDPQQSGRQFPSLIDMANGKRVFDFTNTLKTPWIDVHGKGVPLIDL